MPYLTYLECKNCGKPIPLRYSTLPASLDGLEWWPMGDQPLNFLCPSCKHAFEYSASMIRQNSFEELAIQDLDTNQGVFLISKECADSNCGSLVKLHVIMSAAANDPTLREHCPKARKLLAEAVPVNILCESRQHLVTTLQILPERPSWKLSVVANIKAP